MPIVQITMLQGRSPDIKAALIGKVTAAIVEALRVPKEKVRIILNEISKDNYGEAGIPLSKAGPCGNLGCSFVRTASSLKADETRAAQQEAR